MLELLFRICVGGFLLILIMRTSRVSRAYQDGLLAYIPDWWAFMDKIWEHTEILVPLRCLDLEWFRV